MGHVKLMASCSTVFKSMVSIPNDPKSAKADQPIDIDLKAIVFERFIDLISVTRPEPMINDLTFEVCQDLLTFTEKFDCIQLIPKIRSRLLSTATARGKSALLFLFASDRDDYEMGRFALQRLGEEELLSHCPGASKHYSPWPCPGEIMQYLDKLRPEWRQQVKTLHFDHMVKSLSTGIFAWSFIAPNFFPPKFNSKRTSR
jgi:hypothetical protein